MTRNKIILTTTVSALAGLGLVAGAFALFRATPIAYTATTVEHRTVSEEVSASGSVKPAQSVDLSFERSGRIARVNVKIGDTVKPGQILMELDNGAEAAQINQARALLAQRQAGATSAEIAMAQAAVDAARADLEKTKADVASQGVAAQATLDTADNNLKLASGGEDSQIVTQTYENAVGALQASLPKLDDSLQQADAIIGADNTNANLSFQQVLSVLDQSKLTTANTAYLNAKPYAQAARDAASGLTTMSQHQDIENAIPVEQRALSYTSQLLSAVSDVLNATIAGPGLTQTDLNAKKASIQLTRSGIIAQNNALITAKQSIDNAKNSFATYNIAYNKAQRDLTNIQHSGDGLVKLKQAALSQAQATLALKTQPPRAVDLAPLRAAVEAASVAYGKTVLRTSLGGTVSRVDGKAGAIALPNVPVASVIDQQSFQTDLLVPETDMKKIKLNDPAKITLDAYGTGAVFDAAVVKIDPGATTQNGSTGYIVTLQFTKTDPKIKTGMTANARISTSQKENVLAVPDRLVLQKDDGYYIQIASGTQSELRQIDVGIHGADGWWEVVSGLDGNEQLVESKN